MIDELKRVRHHFLSRSKTARESVAKILDAALQHCVVVDPGIFPKRSLDRIWAFSGELKSVIEGAQKLDGKLAIPRVL